MTDTEQTQAGADPSSGFVLSFDWTAEDEMRSTAIASRLHLTPHADMRRAVIIVFSFWIVACALLAFTEYRVAGGVSWPIALFVGAVLVGFGIGVTKTFLQTAQPKQTAETQQKVDLLENETAHLRNILQKHGMPACLSGQTSVHISPAGLVVIHEPSSARSTFDWASIDQLVRVPEYLVFKSLWRLQVRIPTRAAENEAQIAEILSSCEKWILDSKQGSGAAAADDARHSGTIDQ